MPSASNFNREKDEVLKKLSTIDKSKKGSVDKNIKKLIRHLNKMDDYYTTSSCSGRIMVIDKGAGRKDLSEWLLSSHSSITYKRFSRIFSKYYLASEEFRKSKIWLMEEPAILHVCCRNLDSAKKILDLVRNLSFKRSGIIAFSRRIMLEILDTEKMETLIAEKGKLFLDEEYSRVLIREANQKLSNTKKKLDSFYAEIKGKKVL